MFTAAFDAVFAGADIATIRTPGEQSGESGHHGAVPQPDRAPGRE
jgi:hypothetical protein